MVSICLRRWTKFKHGFNGGHGFGFSLIFLLVVNGYWILIGIFLDLRVLGHSLS